MTAKTHREQVFVVEFPIQTTGNLESRGMQPAQGVGRRFSAVSDMSDDCHLPYSLSMSGELTAFGITTSTFPRWDVSLMSCPL